MPINVKDVIKQSGLNTDEVARHLFPTNKFPKLAFNRILEGKAFLDSSQMSKLATLANITVSELYGGQWKQISKGDIITFTSNSYRAELNIKTWVTRIFDNDSLFHETVINSGATTLSAYIQELNLIIANRK